jgi:hypothetical protein
MKTNTMLLSRSQPLYEMLDQVWAPKAKSKSFSRICRRAKLHTYHCKKKLKVIQSVLHMNDLVMLNAVNKRNMETVAGSGQKLR